MGIKEIVKVTGLPILIASLCCLSPVILVLFGLGTVSFAASLADTLYGSYRWLFRIAGILLLAVSLVWYLRKKRGICTIDEARKRRNEIVNLVLASACIGVIGYIIWLYVVVEYAGKLLDIWK